MCRVDMLAMNVRYWSQVEFKLGKLRGNHVVLRKLDSTE